MPLPRSSAQRQAALFAFCLLSSVFTVPAARAASIPVDRYLYRWSFEAGGLAEIPGMDTFGGELTVAGGESGQVPLFQRTGGVSASSPEVLNASRNLYGSGGAQVNSHGSALRTGKTLERFTVTMWIKPEIPQDQQPQARLFNISTADNEQSPQSIFIAFDNGGLAFCVNESPIWGFQLREPVIKTGEWVFLVFCYDGTTSPFYSQRMQDTYQLAKHAAIFAGDREAPPRLATEVTITTGAPSYAVSPGKVSLDGLLVAIGSGNARFDRSFVGWIDDVRIYDSLLSPADLERVRAEAVGK